MKHPGASGQIKREKMWILGLLLLAFLVRFPFALIPHFWFDEVYTVAMIHYPPGAILRLTAQDAHPPLYYFWVKGFAAAGLRLGGPFATLAWLRLASVAPGLLTCLLAWWAARRCWGGQRALWTLAFFAVSPALTYYSVDLRSYSTVQCLVLAGLIGLLEAAAPGARRPRRGVLLFSLSMILALYVHALAALYLGGMGVIILAELALRPRERQALALRAAAGAAALAAGYLPWCPIVLQQRRWFNGQYLAWWPDAGWSKLPATFFWYLPFGPIAWEIPKIAWGPIALNALGLSLLCANALLLWRRVRRGGAAAAPSAQAPGRLLVYAAVLAVAPLCASFFVTHFNLSKTFLGFRYNLIAAPFFNLALLGLIFAVEPRALRAGLLALVLAVSLGCSLYDLGVKVRDQQDLRSMARGALPELARPGIRLCWLNPVVLPWLGRCGTYELGACEAALAVPGASAASGGDVYFLSHVALGPTSQFWTPACQALQQILERRGAPQLIKTDERGWAAIWRVKPQELPAIAAEWQASRMKP